MIAMGGAAIVEAQPTGEDLLVLSEDSKIGKILCP